MILRVLIFILIIISVKAKATDQIPDIVVCESDTLYLCRDGWAEEIYIPQNAINILYSIDSMSCSGAHRGYQAVWKIIDNKFYLSTLYKACSDEIIELDRLFPDNQIEANGLFVSWLSTKIILDSNYGACGSWAYMMENNNEIEFEINNGNIVAKGN